jgi:hypothetical protein
MYWMKVLLLLAMKTTTTMTMGGWYIEQRSAHGEQRVAIQVDESGA